ncbi:MerR family transcriptional regulator [Lactobacillus sp. CBA3606]|uniref:MerR family transcriptional regulator n=1 Tax=Lactobacillus sp. CBA3606 TaxID=2099789 RepID=UPI000CFD0147|nr:MerR family transcriptional regulator [Lactobacillus sp. CBA3606]AVK64148.1 MerR family transcriptional regulator [Lactobacillus sp. CBA3606]
MNRKEVSNLIGFSTDTLRYYENIGVIPPIKRDQNGYRDYRPNDLNWLFLVKCLKDAGLSMAALIEFATLNQRGENEPAQKAILQEQLTDLNRKLAEMKRTQALLQHKIDTFEDHTAKFKTGEMDADHVEELWRMSQFKIPQPK